MHSTVHAPQESSCAMAVGGSQLRLACIVALASTSAWSPAHQQTPAWPSTHRRPARARPAIAAAARANATYTWNTTTEFEGARVAKLRKRMREPTPAPSLGTVLTNLREQGPARVFIVLLFVLLTLADVFFNMSRGVICALPGGLCEAVVEPPPL